MKFRVVLQVAVTGPREETDELIDSLDQTMFQLAELGTSDAAVDVDLALGRIAVSCVVESDSDGAASDDARDRVRSALLASPLGQRGAGSSTDEFELPSFRSSGTPNAPAWQIGPVEDVVSVVKL